MVGDDMARTLDQGREQLGLDARRLYAGQQMDAGCGQKQLEVFVGGIRDNLDVSGKFRLGSCFLSARNDEEYAWTPFGQVVDDEAYDIARLVVVEVAMVEYKLFCGQRVGRKRGVKEAG